MAIEQKSAPILEIFYSYEQENAAPRPELEAYLNPLLQQKIIAAWHNHNPDLDLEQEQQSYQHLAHAELILLLINAAFLSSAFCRSTEMMQALRRHEAGEALIIPVLIEQVKLAETPFSALQTIPLAGGPVMSEQRENDSSAWEKVVEELHPLIEDFIKTRSGTVSLEATPGIWSVPYPRNAFFCGREDVLQQLHVQFTGSGIAPSIQQQVIYGPAGIGKTQVALEYAYRHQQDYSHILRIDAASEYTLSGDLMKVASTIGLPLETSSLQELIASIKVWLAEQQNWLLIFDNVIELEVLHNYVPESATNGRVLYLANAASTSDLIHIIELPELGTEAGLQLLLQRAGVKLDQVSPQVQTEATTIVQALGSLPLALNQAGAYIDASSYNLAGYLSLYEKQRQALTRWRGRASEGYPESMAATCVLAFQSVERASPAAAELLCLCAFLAGEVIPERLISKGAPVLGAVLSPVAADPSALNQAIELLSKFSLIEYASDEKQLTMHPLIQAILKYEMNQETQREWTERTIAAVDAAFPDEHTPWSAFQPYLHQIQACALLIDYYNVSSFEATKLLNNAALALKEHGQYEQAAPLFQRALAIEEMIAGPEHPATALTLNNLATLYHAQGDYEQAEPYYRRALAIWELEPGLEYPSLSMGYDNLALLYQAQGQYDRVEALRQHSLAITEQVWGAVAPETANCLNNLANLYHAQGKYEQAETLYRRSLAILLKEVGTDHAATASSMNNLGNLYRNWGKEQQAGPLIQRALLIREKVLGPEHLETASSLSDLANLYQDQRHYQQAEKLLLRALAIVEKELGTQHSQVALTLFHLAQCYRAQEKYEQAETLFQRILAIDEHVYGPEHPIVATDLESYADFLLQVQRQEEAQSLQERARAIRTQRRAS